MEQSEKVGRIPLHGQLVYLLKKRSRGHRPEEFVLSGAEHPMEPRTCTNHWKRLLVSAGVRQVNFHILRHTFATECVEQQINIQALSEFLGHSSIRITADRYVHLSMTYKKGQISMLPVCLTTAADAEMAS